MHAFRPYRLKKPCGVMQNRRIIAKLSQEEIEGDEEIDEDGDDFD